MWPGPRQRLRVHRSSASAQCRGRPRFQASVVPSPGHHPPASPLRVQPTRPHCRYSDGSVTSPDTMRPPAEFQPQLATPPSPSTPRQWPSPAATCAGSGGTQLLSSYDTLRWQNRHAWAALLELATHASRAHTPLAGAQAAALPQEPAMLATSLHPQARVCWETGRHRPAET